MNGVDSKIELGEKPPFHVPTMKEVESIRPNGFCVVSTFSGTGGSCLGYRMAGFEILWANEFIPSAQATYAANFPNTFLDTRDIRKISAKDIFTSTGLTIGELDLFDGSPPCDPFSIAGQREKKWGKIKTYSNTEQRTDDLSFEFIRFLKDLQPKTFVMENVAGLLYGKAKGFFKEILKKLKSCGYRVAVRLLDAQWLGIPQMRQRTIFVGVREDLQIEPTHPKPLPYRYTMREAFGNGNGNGIDGEHRKLNPGTKLFRLWQWSKQNKTTYFDKAHESIFGTNSMFSHCRTNFDAPCPTVCQGATSLYHEEIPRTLTVPELKKIASFPDDFQFIGSFNQTWERIGNCVPPLMMKCIAEVVRAEILQKIDSKGVDKHSVK